MDNPTDDEALTSDVFQKLVEDPNTHLEPWLTQKIHSATQTFAGSIAQLKQSIRHLKDSHLKRFSPQWNQLVPPPTASKGLSQPPSVVKAPQITQEPSQGQFSWEAKLPTQKGQWLDKAPNDELNPTQILEAKPNPILAKGALIEEAKGSPKSSLPEASLQKPKDLSQSKIQDTAPQTSSVDLDKKLKDRLKRVSHLMDQDKGQTI